jgi:lipopolysaccharide transport system permease protein
MSLTASTAVPQRRAASRVVIEPTTGLLPYRPRELWSHRDLFAFLVWRDIKVRYAQTALGGIWMVFQPLAMMLVYTFAFSHLVKVHVPGGAPYPVFALAGLTMWIFVSRGVLLGAESLVVNIPLVTKTACPRVLIPAAGVVSVFADFLVALGLFLVLSAVYGLFPDPRFLLVLPVLLVAFLFTLGLALLLSVTNVRYRDVGQALPFLVQLWFFLSPVAYVLQTPGRSWETAIQALNPLVGIIQALRWCLLGTPAPHGMFIVAVVISLATFVAGLAHFARNQRTIADDV